MGPLVCFTVSILAIDPRNCQGGCTEQQTQDILGAHPLQTFTKHHDNFQ